MSVASVDAMWDDIAALVRRWLDEALVPTAAAVPTRTGDLLATHHGWHVAVLRWVDGEPLTSRPQDQSVMGTTLARVHHVLLAVPTRLDDRFPWLDPSRPALDIEDWIRPALADALAGYRRAPGRTVTRHAVAERQHGRPGPCPPRRSATVSAPWFDSGGICRRTTSRIGASRETSLAWPSQPQMSAASPTPVMDSSSRLSRRRLRPVGTTTSTLQGR